MKENKNNNNNYNYRPVYNIEYDVLEYRIYLDILNNRKLIPIDFFKFIKEKYNSVENVRNIANILKKRGQEISARNLLIILDYKSACLLKKKEEVKKLKNDFNKLEDISPLGYAKINKREYNKIKKETTTKKDINEKIEEYLNNSDMHTTENYNKIREEVIKQINNVKIDNYIKFVCNKHNVEVVNEQDIEDLLKVVKFFIFNLENNLWELYVYNNVLTTAKYDLEHIKLTDEQKEVIQKRIELYNQKVLDLVPEIFEGTGKHTANRICIYKIRRVKKLVEGYKELTEKLSILKENFSLGEFNKLNHITIELKDDFVVKTVSEINNFIKGYNSIKGSVYKKELEVKEEFAKKYYMPKN